tara:strand:- start:12519 stop:12728 length:210 start_codon:yes stop_codon:yes gene_type:complete
MVRIKERNKMQNNMRHLEREAEEIEERMRLFMLRVSLDNVSKHDTAYQQKIDKVLKNMKTVVHHFELAV